MLPNKNHLLLWQIRGYNDLLFLFCFFYVICYKRIIQIVFFLKNSIIYHFSHFVCMDDIHTHNVSFKMLTSFIYIYIFMFLHDSLQCSLTVVSPSPTTSHHIQIQIQLHNTQHICSHCPSLPSQLLLLFFFFNI